jgi:hypothetical protein
MIFVVWDVGFATAYFVAKLPILLAAVRVF